VEIIAQATETFKVPLRIFLFIPIPQFFHVRNNNMKCAVRGMFLQMVCSFGHG